MWTSRSLFLPGHLICPAGPRVALPSRSPWRCSPAWRRLPRPPGTAPWHTHTHTHTYTLRRSKRKALMNEYPFPGTTWTATGSLEIHHLSSQQQFWYKDCVKGSEELPVQTEALPDQTFRSKQGLTGSGGGYTMTCTSQPGLRNRLKTWNSLVNTQNCSYVRLVRSKTRCDAVARLCPVTEEQSRVGLVLVLTVWFCPSGGQIWGPKVLSYNIRDLSQINTYMDSNNRGWLFILVLLFTIFVGLIPLFQLQTLNNMWQTSSSIIMEDDVYQKNISNSQEKVFLFIRVFL